MPKKSQESIDQRHKKPASKLTVHGPNLEKEGKLNSDKNPEKVGKHNTGGTNQKEIQERESHEENLHSKGTQE